MEEVKTKKPSRLKRFIRISFKIANHCIAKTIVAPYDRIKLLQQLSPLLNSSSEQRNTYNMFRFLLKEQGFLSLWRGNLSGCLAIIPSILVKELLDPYIRNFIVRHEPDQSKLSF